MTKAKLKIYGNFITSLATISKCKQFGTAAMITDKKGNKVYSIGVNGGTEGAYECICGLSNKYTCVHAEANAISACNTLDDCTVMFCTLSPCITCAAAIVNAGIKVVYYITEWKDKIGIDLLRKSGIYCVQLSEATKEYTVPDYYDD